MSKPRAAKRPRQGIAPALQPSEADASKQPPVTPTGTTIPDKAPDSTPVSHKISGTQVHASKLLARDNGFKQLAYEMRGCWIGPMDPADFLKEFLPEAEGCPKLDSSLFDHIFKIQGEKKRYTPLVKALAPYAPQLNLVNTGANNDKKYGNAAPDISAYRVTSNIKFESGDEAKADIVGGAQPVDNKKDRKVRAGGDDENKGEGKGASENAQVQSGKSDFSQMEIPIEVKEKAVQDPFVTNNKEAATGNPFPFEKQTLEGTKIRGQIACYSNALTAAQFRVHSFSVLICGSYARLLRWDRNGAIVTERFLFAEENHLVEFLWRYSQLADDHPARGHDPTVQPIPQDRKVTSKEETARAELIEANKTNHREFRKMSIPDRDNANKESDFLISYPPSFNVTRISPTGRATRPMLAFDLTTQKLVFVKDYWRPFGSDFDKEGDIYKILQEKEVPHIATFGKGNDVRDHITVTDTKKTEKWAYPSYKMVPLRHYRMSLKEVGYSLQKFRSSYELVTAIADAMEAHECARTNAQVLHRDISAGNIVITNNGRGLLIDWDLSVKIDPNNNTKARRANRTGTWQFMSVAVLKDPQHRQDDIDDREAAFYVLVWNLMRSAQHNKLEDLYEALKIFDQIDVRGTKGGTLKEHFLITDVRNWTFTGRPLLNALVQELALIFRVRYEEPVSEGLLEFYKTEAGAGLRENPIARREKLQDGSWLVETMRKYLARQTEENWPTGDAAKLNDLSSPVDPENVQRNHQSELSSRGYFPRKRRHDDIVEDYETQLPEVEEEQGEGEEEQKDEEG